MDVIGNNLANSNTLGYKAGNTYFASMLNQSLSASGSLSVGQGVQVSTIATQYGQGSFETTGNATDLAIDGDGFFLVEDTEGAIYYTRAGAFHIDDEGFLVDGNGYKVQGYNTFNTAAVDEQTDISLKNVQSSPSASTEVTIGANLDENTTAGEKFNVSQSVFDSKGKLHNLSITFLKTEGSGMWGFEAKLDSTNLADTADQAGCGIIFDENGTLSGMYKGNAANTSQWNAGTVAGTAETSAGAIAGTTIVNAGNLDQAATGILLTKGAGTTWTVANAAAYPGATAAQRTGATNEFLDVDLDGVGGADITFDLGATAGNLWAATDTITYNIVNAGTGTIDSANTVVNKPGQIYQNATGITFTKTSSANVWNLTNAAGYANATASQVTIGGVQYLQVDLDGAGGTDMTLQLDGTWVAGNTVQFDVGRTDVAAQDLILTFGALDNGATIGIPEGSGATAENKITWDVVGTEINKITGYASTSVVKSLGDNGYTSGVLKSLDIGTDGIIMGSFTNGQTSQLGQLILADFPNTTGLKKVGNYFAETTESGEAIKNKPGSGGLGEIQSNSLEMSNTDVAKEFINMITAQRAYQASSRIITTADQMLTELMNIKR